MEQRPFDRTHVDHVEENQAVDWTLLDDRAFHRTLVDEYRPIEDRAVDRTPV
jgi:hypothetical protein